MKKILITGIVTLTLVSSMFGFSYKPYISENGDRYGWDNDGDGRIETVFVKGHYRDGYYVRSHYRAK